MAESRQPTRQEREARRLEKVEAFKRQQARQRRNRRLAIGGTVVGVLVVVALVVTAIVVTRPAPTEPAAPVTGVTYFDGLTGSHVDPEPVDYEARYGMNPPAGGDHWAAWLNCGVYDQPQENERAVHALEHGAVWITYDPEKVTGDDLETLRERTPDTYAVLSPYPGLPAPVVVSAWANQLQLDGVDDERLDSFIQQFWKSGDAPELGAPCTGAVDGPGRVG